MSEQPNNPLHGLTLETILTKLQDKFGWDGLYARIRVNCFVSNPSIKSALKFLRKTQWARDKVEALYIHTFASASSTPPPQRPRFDKKSSMPKAEKSPYQSSVANKPKWPDSDRTDAKKAESKKSDSKTSNPPPTNVWTMNR
ncbi:DNA-binding protein VF530 [Alteromonas sp. a30]|nr:DNA-binding protein VF530 [Alteromonas sp. a30]